MRNLPAARRFWFTKALLVLAAATFYAGVTAAPGSPTTSGQISDSLCGAVHPEDPDVACGGGQPGPKNPYDCTIACVRGGSKYVLASHSGVAQFANQNDPVLKKSAGSYVMVTGKAVGRTVAASKIDTIYQ